MSFSAPAPGPEGLPDADSADSGEPLGTPYDETTDWGKVGALAAGIVIGAVVGAGAALLLAPQSGADSRRAMLRAGRRGKRRARDAWEHLGDELWWLARRKKKQVRRGATRTGWMVQDLLDNIVGPARGRGRPPRHDHDEAEESSRGRIEVEEE